MKNQDYPDTLYVSDLIAPDTVSTMPEKTLRSYADHGSRDLGHERRADLSDRIDSYRRGVDPLSVPMAILAHYASDGELPWLAGQTYLQPFPAALGLRHNVPR